MALQLWMPLTKDLRQQGVSGVVPTQTTGYTSVATGKLGGCYKFTGTFDTLLPFSNWDWTEGSVSFGCWAKISQSELATLVNAQTYDATYNSMGGTLLGRDSYGGLGLRWKTNNIYADSTLNAVYIYTHIRNTSSSSNNTNTYIIPFDTWFHVMMVLDRVNSKINIYINGELFTSANLTVTGSFTTGTFRIAEATWDGGNGKTSAGCWQLNDVRVYDNALSSMEVKQISQGLVLHYPLNRNGWGQENLVCGYRTSGSLGSYSTTIASTVYEVDNQMPSGYHTKITLNTASGTGGPYWLGTTTTDGTGTQISQLVADNWYTVSYYIKSDKVHSSNIFTTAEFLKNVSFIKRPIINTSWQKVVFKGQYNGNTSSMIAITIYEGAKWTTGETVYLSSVKVESGQIATNWTPYYNDSLATTIGLNSTTEYDCSGFCNNGEKIGTLAYISDTPKYQVSTHIGSTSSKIHISNLSTSGFGNSYSFAWWGKASAFNTGSMMWGFSDGVRLNGFHGGNLWNTGNSGQNPLYIPGTTTQVSVPTGGEWHHFVMVGDGTTCKAYKDGELWGQAKTYKSISGTSIYINGWDSGTSYTFDNLNMSDFRIYATALSTSDVKSLYQNCATIDADGTIRGQIRS